MTKRTKFKKIIIPIVIILAGFLGMRLLVLSKSTPQKRVMEKPTISVEVIKVNLKDHRITVTGTGIVQASREVTITPQVNGLVTYLSPDFIAGGFFKKGELLFEIDKSDYQISLNRAKANLDKLEHELNRAETLFKDKLISKQDIEKTQDNYNTLLASLEQAKLDLERTRIYAPFNCVILSEEIDMGQYVKSGSSVATIAGTDTAEIEIPLPLEELLWLDVPKQNSRERGAPAIVSVSTGNQIYKWEGHVVRTLGEVDEKGRMARVVVEIDDPYNQKKKISGRHPDLKVGMFVEVELHGKILSNIAEIPRGALLQDSTVWIVDEENKLRSRPVTVTRRGKETLIISEGLNDGERVMLTTVSGASEGLQVKPVEKGAA